ncbi:MAG: phage holin family protein [Phycisphaerales bacterium]
MDITKVFDSLSQCWQMKILASFFVTCFTFLVGGLEAPFIALWLLVAIDTLTRWAAISKHTIDDQQVDGNILYGFYLSWHTGALNSHAMRHQFTLKVFAYLILIIVGNLVSKIIPSLALFGSDISKIPGGFIYSFLGITELMSIIENLIDMGMDVLKPLAVWACRKRNDMTGGTGGGTGA